MMISVRITLFPTAAQRRELQAMEQVGRGLREGFVTRLDQREQSWPLPLSKQAGHLPEAMIEAAMKQARRIHQAPRSHSQQHRIPVPWLWKRSEFQLADNQLHVYPLKEAIYYIAPVAQRRQMRLGTPVRLRICRDEQTWTAILCLWRADEKKPAKPVQSKSMWLKT